MDIFMKRINYRSLILGLVFIAIALTCTGNALAQEAMPVTLEVRDGATGAPVSNIIVGIQSSGPPSRGL